MIRKIINRVAIVFFFFGALLSQIYAQIEYSPTPLPIDTKLLSNFFHPRTQPINLDISGYVKTDAFWDTRQTVSYQETNILLLPQKKTFDIYGDDVAAHGEYNIMPIETTVRIAFDIPEINNIKISGAVEANYWGQPSYTVDEQLIEPPNTSINLFLLQHGYLKLDWEDFSFLAGQTTHPIAYPWPNTVAFNVGMPIAPFSLSPQLRFTYHSPIGDFILCANSELNWQTNGPGDYITEYIRNAILPNLHAHMRVNMNENNIFGFAADIKRIVPRLVTDNNVKANEHLWSGAVMAYFDLNFEPYSLIAKAIWAQNGVDYDLIGGYAVSSINPITDQRTYTNFNTISFFIDSQRAGTIEPGIYAGVLKNLGTTKNIIPSYTSPGGTTSLVYGFAPNTDTAFRVSPRVRYHIEPVVLAAEVEYTRAAWGTLDNQGKVIHTDPTSVVRFEFGFYLYF